LLSLVVVNSHQREQVFLVWKLAHVYSTVSDYTVVLSVFKINKYWQEGYLG